MRKKRIGKTVRRSTFDLVLAFALDCLKNNDKKIVRRTAVLIALARMCGVLHSYTHFQPLSVRNARLVSSIWQHCSSDENFPDVSCMFSCLSWQEDCESLAYRRSVFV
jgi:hypothetical protein